MVPMLTLEEGNIAAFCKLLVLYSLPKELIRELIDAGADVNAQGGEYRSALEAASYRSSGKIMRILLDAGAEVNAQGGVYGNSLQAACASRYAQGKLVRMLLDAGAEINTQGGKFGSALQAVLMKRDRAGIRLEVEDKLNSSSESPASFD